jgi:predicted membrane metal-binding protein
MKQKILFALLMSVVTTEIISFSVIAFNVGFSANFLNLWFKSWLIAYIIAVPAILLIAPQVEKLVWVILSEKKLK